MDHTFILNKFNELIQSGIVLYDEDQRIVEHVEGDLKYQFCVTSALSRKPTFQSPQPESNEPSEKTRQPGSDISTAGFEIGPVGDAHQLVANKFCWANPHFLLVTADAGQRQYQRLHETDLHAMWSVLTTMNSDYVAFFNCGQDGGCSRMHKHMQLIPTPPGTLASFLDGDEGSSEPVVPFYWFYHRFTSSDVKVEDLQEIYTRLLEQATSVGDGLSEHAQEAPPDAACPHNVIMSRRWMIVIPRRRAALSKAIATNALGMLGYFAVATQGEVYEWKQVGVTGTLEKFGVSKRSDH
ncbi:hypothetical protein N7539_005252 [Penicillium diatomitis]|uniref:Ap4A phosphorylase II n=1 Tax=Penicillium diatomitis TaxID=2819901 RepID=A0A9X0BUK6_9EURO|nr:uncharacterized protein N7539_005252 [Penicillium diatomitis]KAJ5485264.1 hypothetical protein N7539_005252 [Penicillium diatomitis]